LGRDQGCVRLFEKSTIAREFSAMLKVILQLYPVIPAASEEERAALRPIGRNRERYQEALTGWHEIFKVADEL
jgi:hypothetical protein